VHIFVGLVLFLTTSFTAKRKNILLNIREYLIFILKWWKRALNICGIKKKAENTARRNNKTLRRLRAYGGAHPLSRSVPSIESRNNDRHCILLNFSVFGLREWGSLKVRSAQYDRSRQQEIERARPGSGMT